VATRDEVLAVRAGAGAWALPEIGVLTATGKDRLSWVNGMVSNDVLGIPDGGSAPAGILTAKGRFVALVDVWREPDTVWLLVEGARAEAAHRTLEGLLVMEEVDLADRSGDFEVWTVQGPNARYVSPEALRREKDRSGAGGFDLLVPRGTAIDPSVTRVGAEAAEVLRVEAGVCAWGREVDEDVFPQEAKLEDTHVSFRKGCFVGQETVVRLRDRGHANRLLVGLDLGDASPPAARASIRSTDGAELGFVTSAVRSPTLERTIAMGLVRRAQAEPGTALSAGDAAATVVPLPFVGPR
jgi:folate-binding protein YgfZ